MKPLFDYDYDYEHEHEHEHEHEYGYVEETPVCDAFVKRDDFVDERDNANPLGIAAWFGIRVPFEERLQLMREAGFECTCLWWEEDREAMRRLRDIAVEKVRDAGLRLDNIHVPYRRCADLWSENAAERLETVDEHVGWINDAARHAVPRIVMHVATGQSTPGPNEPGLDSMRRILDAAGEHGVEVAIENTRRPEHVDYLLENVQDEHLSFCFDTSHDRLYHGRHLEQLRQWAHRLGTTHLSDTDGKLDRHWVPGRGVVGWETVAKTLPRYDYSGAYLLEVVGSDKNADPRGFLRDARAALEDCLQIARTTGDRSVIRGTPTRPNLPDSPA